MGVFKDGKDSGGAGTEGIDEAVIAAMERAGDGLMEKLAKAIKGFNPGLISTDRDEDDGETMRALARVASANIGVGKSNFSKLGKDEAVTSATNIDEAIGTIGEIE